MRYCNQRFEFAVSFECMEARFLIADAVCDMSQPIFCNGIYSHLCFRQPNGSVDMMQPQNCEPFLYFRGCVFKQRGKTAMMAKCPRINKRKWTVFTARDISDRRLSELFGPVALLQDHSRGLY